MKIREFQLEELSRSRSLQYEAAKLHCPMPVLSWQFEVKDRHNNVIEKGIGKANSFTRNALNMLTWFLGAASKVNNAGIFGDGILGIKSTDGVVVDFNSSYNQGRYPTSDVVVYVGTGTSESLDDYNLPDYGCTTSIGSSFNTTSRKLITVISGVWKNTTSASIDITDAGIRQAIASSGFCLTVHDVFSAITVPNNATIIWTYVSEVVYPNP